MNITKSIHLYGAVLLLLAGQAVLGRAERIQARDFNSCVRIKAGKNARHTGLTQPQYQALNRAVGVTMCNAIPERKD